MATANRCYQERARKTSDLTTSGSTGIREVLLADQQRAQSLSIGTYEHPSRYAC